MLFLIFVLSLMLTYSVRMGPSRGFTMAHSPVQRKAAKAPWRKSMFFPASRQVFFDQIHIGAAAAVLAVAQLLIYIPVPYEVVERPLDGGARDGKV